MIESIIIYIAVITTCAIPFMIVLLKMFNTFLHKMYARWEVENIAISNSVIMDIVAQGANYAEQEAFKKQKEILEKIPSKDKLYVAVQYIADEFRRHKLPTLTEEEIEYKIESYLGTIILSKNEIISDMGNYKLEDEGENYENFPID